MPRPKKCRFVEEHPDVTYFKPCGIPMSELEDVKLPVEGFEAIRLADMDDLEHEDAAVKMGISRPTFSRILSAARKSVAKALVEGLAIRIEGGKYEIKSGKKAGERCCSE